MTYKKNKMKIITINVPHSYIGKFDELKDRGYINSRSEGIRQAITDWFERFAVVIETVEQDELIVKNYPKRKEWVVVEEGPQVGDLRERDGYLEEYRDYKKYQKWCAIGRL